jgi:hypothetical protein
MCDWNGTFFFILFDKARKRRMSCINSIWVTKIGIDGLNGKVVLGKEEAFPLIISAQEFQTLASPTGCCDDIRNTKAANW